MEPLGDESQAHWWALGSELGSWPQGGRCPRDGLKWWRRFMGLFVNSPLSLLITRIMKPRSWKTQASQLVLGSWGRWRNVIFMKCFKSEILLLVIPFLRWHQGWFSSLSTTLSINIILDWFSEQLLHGRKNAGLGNRNNEFTSWLY